MVRGVLVPGDKAGVSGDRAGDRRAENMHLNYSANVIADNEEGGREGGGLAERPATKLLQSLAISYHL
jgi:hypothetical protein